MAFPQGYVELLEKLAIVFSAYRDRTGHAPLLVGGAATAIMTIGSFMSGDFDIIAPDDHALVGAMEDNGFVSEDRVGYMPKGFYHPDHPEYGFEQVSGLPFDGRSDRERLVHQVMRGGHEIVLPSFEDMIADRLAQHAVASPSDDSRLRQARMILMMAKDVDVHYLRRRVDEEQGDVNLLDLDALERKE